MSSLIRAWTEGSQQPSCPVVTVLLYDLLLCLLTPLYLITTIMLVLTSKPAEDVFGGDNGYIATREPAACARVSVVMMVNFVAMEGNILMFYFRKPTVCSFVCAMLLSLWSGITLGEFFSYGCTTLRFPALPPAIRLLTYLCVYARMVAQVLDCLWTLLMDSNSGGGGFWSDNDLHPELIAEEEEEQQAPSSGSEVRAARRARRAALRRNAELQLAANTPASNLYQQGRLSSSSGSASPASAHLASALPPVFSLGAAAASAASPAPSAVVRAVFADLRSASPASTEEFGSGCVICLGEFAAVTLTAAAMESSPPTPRGQSRVFLPCCHSFHRACIDAWFRSCMLQLKPQVCPTCRHCPETAR